MFLERPQFRELALNVWASTSLMIKATNCFVYHDSPLVRNKMAAK